MKTLSLLFFLYSAPLMAQIMATGHSSFYPFSFEEKAELSGLGAWVTGQVLKEFNLPSKIFQMPWKRALKGCREGTLDILIAVHTSRRKDNMFHITTPYADNETVVVINKNNAIKVAHWRDLFDFRGITIRGVKYSSAVEAAINKKTITRVENGIQLLGMLIKNRVDYAISSSYATIISAQAQGFQNQLKSLERPRYKEPISLAICNSSPLLGKIKQINKIIKTLRTSGKIAKVRDRFIAELRVSSKQ